jgi:hypothetical protein
MALPTIYDLSTPYGNLASLMDLDASIVPAVLSDNRFLMGADLVPMLFAGAHGYRRSHSFLQTLLWGLAGYMAPFPVVAVAAFEGATGNRAFGTALEGLEGRCLRYGHRTVRGKRKRICKKYAS